MRKAVKRAVLFAAAGAALFAATPAAAEPPALTLPLTCAPGKTCDVIKLFDHDPGPGRRDYACGVLNGGEDNYPGVSIAIRDVPTMQAGVDVRAAAAGTVLRRRDGVADTGVYGPETREALSAQGCGNALVLDHGDGWTTVYCHLRKDSLRAAQGERVAAGQTIAQVGMSGLTELPHLHFQVRRNNQAVDPFTGTAADAGRAACGPGPQPLWTPETLAQLSPYRPVVLRLAGFAEGETTVRAAREGRHAKRFPVCAGAMVFWAEIIGPRAGDRLRLRVTAPNGRPVLEQTATVERDYAQMFPQARAARPGPAWPEGFYRGTVELRRGEETFVTETSVQTSRDGC